MIIVLLVFQDHADVRSTPSYNEGILSSVPSFIRYKISQIQTILVIMVLRDCNSNILNDFIRFFEFKN